MDLKNKIIDEIKKIYDPEIPVNIYELGLIYKIDIDKKNLGLDPICLDNHLNHICDYKNGFLINKKTGRRISAICPVHVFGNPANCIELKKISDILLPTWDSKNSSVFVGLIVFER